MLCTGFYAYLVSPYLLFFLLRKYEILLQKKTKKKLDLVQLFKQLKLSSGQVLQV